MKLLEVKTAGVKMHYDMKLTPAKAERYGEDIEDDEAVDWLIGEIGIPYMAKAELGALWVKWREEHPGFKQHVMPFVRWAFDNNIQQRLFDLHTVEEIVNDTKQTGDEVYFSGNLDLSGVSKNDDFPPPPFKRFVFTKEFDVSNNGFTKIEPWFPTKSEHIYLKNNKISSLSGMDKIIKEVKHSINLDGNPIESGLLSLLKIKTGPNFRLSIRTTPLHVAAEQILVKYFKEPYGNKRVLECQNEMLDYSKYDLSELATL